MTQKGQGRDPNVLRAQYLEKKLEMLFSNNRQLLDTCSLLWGTTVGYPSDSLASCLSMCLDIQRCVAELYTLQ